MNRFSLTKAFDRGIRKVSWWWIPLCALSCVLIFNKDYLPKYVIAQFDEIPTFQPYKDAFDVFAHELKTTVPPDPKSADRFVDSFKEISMRPEIIEAWDSCEKKIVLLSIYTLGVASVLYVLMIMPAKAAVSRKEEVQLKRDYKRTMKVALGWLAIVPLKAAAGVTFFSAFFAMIIWLALAVLGLIGLWLGPAIAIIGICGFAVYLKLYFTGLILTGDSANPLKAVSESWSITYGCLLKLTVVFCFETIITILGGVTVIGLIPAEPMRYTVRASIYRQLKGVDNNE